MLQDGADGSNGTSFYVGNFSRADRPSKVSGFNPQGGIVTLNTSVFIINVAGAIPEITAAVSALAAV